jgi:hypothetical protein
VKQPEKRPMWLRRLSLHEVSLVDFGANQHAKVEIFKRGLPSPDTTPQPQKEAIMADLTQMEKALADLRDAQSKVVNLTAELSVAKKATEEAMADTRAANRALADVNIKLEQEVSKHLDPTEVLLKSMSAPVREAYLAQQTQMTNLTKRLAEDDDKRAVAEIEKAISRDMAGLPIPAAELAPVLKAAKAKLTAAEVETLDRVLKAGSAALLDAKKMFGLTQGVTKSSTEVTVEKLAREQAVAKGITFEQAYSAILKADPSLYSAILAEQTAH